MTAVKKPNRKRMPRKYVEVPTELRNTVNFRSLSAANVYISLARILIDR
jgi:hypothetical protein